MQVFAQADTDSIRIHHAWKQSVDICRPRGHVVRRGQVGFFFTVARFNVKGGSGRCDLASKYGIYQKPSPVELRNAVDVF
jgi:hypothetical protein